MDIDEATDGALEEIPRAEALRLLAGEPVGRLVYTRNALPAITPVNFVVHEGRVLIVTGHGAVLAQAVRGAIVAFEVDRVDPATHTGWSVTAIGRATTVSDERDIERLRNVLPRPWAGGVRDHVVSVGIDMVTGRRVGAAGVPM